MNTIEKSRHMTRCVCENKQAKPELKSYDRRWENRWNSSKNRYLTKSNLIIFSDDFKRFISCSAFIDLTETFKPTNRCLILTGKTLLRFIPKKRNFSFYFSSQTKSIYISYIKFFHSIYLWRSLRCYFIFDSQRWNFSPFWKRINSI